MLKETPLPFSLNHLIYDLACRGRSICIVSVCLPSFKCDMTNMNKYCEHQTKSLKPINQQMSETAMRSSNRETSQYKRRVSVQRQPFFFSTRQKFSSLYQNIHRNYLHHIFYSYLINVLKLISLKRIDFFSQLIREKKKIQFN